MPPYDQFPARSPGLSAREGFAVTPDNDNDLETYPQALWVGTGGDVEVIFVPGTDAVVLANVPSGHLLPIAPSRVLATNTTATEIVALL